MSIEERLTLAVEHLARMTTKLANTTEREDRRIVAALESQAAIINETHALRKDMPLNKQDQSQFPQIHISQYFVTLNIQSKS